MYTDVITYNLAEGVTEDALLKAAKDVHKSWMSKQPGFVRWTIAKTEAGDYTDIVEWDSKEAAVKAEEAMASLPPDTAWFTCYDVQSIQSTSLHSVQTF